MGTDQSTHAVSQQEQRFTGVPVIDVCSQRSQRRQVLIESVEVAAQPGRGAMADVVGAYYRDAPCIKSGRYALISTRVFGQAVNKQHSGPRVFDWPVPVLNAAGETFHVVVLRFALRSLRAGVGTLLSAREDNP